MGDGLLIYEGMRLTVFSDGTYDLSFTATVPDMPVTIRLQLWLQPPPPPDTPATILPTCNNREYRITLPPIRLEPKVDARAGDPTANTFQVAHRGYSSLFRSTKHVVTTQPHPTGVTPINAQFGFPMTPRQHSNDQVHVDASWDVRRVGTARFGSAVAVDDTNRIISP
jgi:hypothetical protein